MKRTELDKDIDIAFMHYHIEMLYLQLIEEIQKFKNKDINELIDKYLKEINNIQSTMIGVKKIGDNMFTLDNE